MTRRLLLVGGSAGSGKSTVARSLASELGAGWLQLDTVWVALKAAAGPGTPAYDELAVDERIADENDSDEAILAALVAAAKTVCRVLPEVFAFELTTHGVLVVDGAWLVPSFVAGLALDDTAAAAIYLQHTSPEGVTTALARGWPVASVRRGTSGWIVGSGSTATGWRPRLGATASRCSTRFRSKPSTQGSRTGSASAASCEYPTLTNDSRKHLVKFRCPRLSVFTMACSRSAVFSSPSGRVAGHADVAGRVGLAASQARRVGADRWRH
jgi:hypothetical protein